MVMMASNSNLRWKCASYLYIMLYYTSPMMILFPKINEIINWARTLA